MREYSTEERDAYFFGGEFSPAESYIDRFGKPLGFCQSPGCLQDRHPQSDSNECPLHTLLTVKAMQAEDDDPENPYWVEEIAKWEGLAK